MDAREKWDRIYSANVLQEPKACWVLSEYAYLLPESGKAVDIASGRGANALLLAGAGLQTTAIDISPVGIEQLQSNAQKRSLNIETRVEDLSASSQGTGSQGTESLGTGPLGTGPLGTGPLGTEQWDVIVVSNYLQRDLFESIVSALRPDGLVYFETFVKNKSDPSVGPASPEYLLDNNELLNSFAGLSVRVFFDLQTAGSCEQGLRNKSCLVAQKSTQK